MSRAVRILDPFCRASAPGVAALTVVLAIAVQPVGAAKKSSDGWPEISADERKLQAVPQDPEADAVVLHKEREGRMVKRADDWVNVMEYFWRLKVLTEAGRRYGEVRIPAEKYSRVSNIRARTVKPDGTILAVAAEDIHENVVFQSGSLKLTEWVFHFPAVEPGAILEYRYDRHDNFLLFIDPWYFEGPEFTLRSRVRQAIPKAASYMVLCDLCGGKEAELSRWREGEIEGQWYTLELTNLPGYRDEILMPPRRDVSPRMEMVLRSWEGTYWKALGRQDRLFEDWESVARWARYYYEQAIKSGWSDLLPVARGWVEGIEDPDQKVRAVLQHVQEDFAYIPWGSVAGASRSVADLLKAGTADNEEKAVLLKGALEAIGVTSEIALVSGVHAGSVNPKFLSMSQFTHAVVLLPGAEGGSVLLDPTLAHADLGFVGWRDSGADCLLLGEGSAGLSKLSSKREPASTRTEVRVKPFADGRAELQINARFAGEEALPLRQRLAPASETARASEVQRWLEAQRPGAVASSFELEQLDDPSEDLVLRIEAVAPGLVTVADDLIAVSACVLSCYDSSPVQRKARAHPYYVDRTWRDMQTVTVTAPEGMKPAPAPRGVTAKVPLATFSLRCTARDDEVECSRTFSASRNRWSAAEAPRVQELFESIVEADQTSIAFEPAGS